MKAFVVLVCFFLEYSSIYAADPGIINNNIQVLDFDRFEPLLYRETDTVYVVNFWATWCAPCIREIPDFEKLNKEYSSSLVKVLLVSLDFPGQLQSRVIPFLERLDVQSEVILLDDTRANRWIPKVSEEWSGAIPATLVYSRNSRAFYEKELKFEELEEIVKPLITLNPKPNH